MNIVFIALIIGAIIALFCTNTKFLEPYMVGWAFVYVLIYVIRWLL